eukprot:TRINITY_DN3352_c0_g1_i10.p1 TRINITY_DN3352_c0_g1~~TRINITY_DN3352_c0_g1_i10.p1  ORF type:complete len:216 (-),score=60.30 TRINITY_DN3352_c0_g1_i10:21-668(-)
MISTQLQFSLKDETTYMALDIFDRYLAIQTVHYSKLSLLGLVSLLVAAKYEEIYPPHLRDLTACCDEEFKRSEVLAMELEVLKGLKFDLSVPSVLCFLRRVEKVVGASEMEINLAMFVCEVQALSGKMSSHSHSLLATSGFYLAKKAMDNGFKLEGLPLKEMKHTKEEVENCAKEMLANVLVKEKIALSNISLSLIHICRCRRYAVCRSRWSPYH